MKVKIAPKLGYCFGVSQAIDKAIKYAEEHGKVYTIGTLAHNEHVVQFLQAKGVEPLPFEKPHSAMPDEWVKIALNANVAITAHGAPPKVYERLQMVTRNILDCTCPIVRRTQEVVSQLDGFDVLIFGDPNHQEVKGLAGWAKGVKFIGIWQDLFSAKLTLGKRVGVVSQTTKVPEEYADFVMALGYQYMAKIEELRVFNTLCPIVAGRFEEAKKLAKEVDIMFVVGSQESANTQNLARVCQVPGGRKPFQVMDIGQVLSEDTNRDWGGLTAGVTAGTSTPIELVETLVKMLEEL